LDVTSSESEGEDVTESHQATKGSAAAAGRGRGRGRGKGKGRGDRGVADVHKLPEALEEGEIEEGDDVILNKADMQQHRQQQQRRRPLEPFEVPRSGAFYAHDDRGEQEEPQAAG
jgi:hypothetical protein